MTMRQSALLAMRSPPRLSRCRLVFPEAGTGDTPHKLANAASERRRSGLSPAATRRARLQVLLYDASRDSIVGRGRTIPFRWDGTLEDLPAGIDALGLRAIDDPEPPTALSALAAEVAEDQQGSGLSGLIITSMTAVARGAGLAPLVAPVRPSWKDRYPLTPARPRDLQRATAAYNVGELPRRVIPTPVCPMSRIAPHLAPRSLQYGRRCPSVA